MCKRAVTTGMYVAVSALRLRGNSKGLWGLDVGTGALMIRLGVRGYCKNTRLEGYSFNYSGHT